MDPITQLIVGILLQLVIAGVQSLFQTAQEAPKAPNLRGEETRGGDEPFSFIVGTYASAGHFNYHSSWGVSGGSPTAYYTKETGYSDLPITGYIGSILDEQEFTLNQSTALTDKGYPQANYHDGTRDNFWTRAYTGNQISADSLLLSKSGSDPIRPYSADMVGEGIAKVVYTARTQRELFTQFPRLKMVMEGIPLYDISKDTSAGGSGAHRWGTRATYEFSDNPAVIIYNILRGISDENGNLVYGGGYEAWQLPYVTFNTAIGVANQSMPRQGGLPNEKRFRVGAEVRGNTAPATLIQSLLTCASGRIADSRGVINLVLGPPPTATASISDDDFEVVESDQTAELLLSINKTRNSMTGSYLSPEENWTAKQLPTIAPGALLAEDGGFSRPGNMDLKNLFSNTQGQRVLKAALLDNRRIRIHAGTLPPEFMGLQVYDTIEWTSAREQYTAKTFEIIAIDDLPNAHQAVVLRETDASDHDFDSGVDEQDYDFVPLTKNVITVREVVSFSFLPATIDDDTGPRRPGVAATWDADMDDVRAVSIQGRVKSTQLLVFEKNDNDPKSSPVLLGSPAFMADVEYEFRLLYNLHSTQRANWSSWITVRMNKVYLTWKDFSEVIQTASVESRRVERQLREDIERITAVAADQDLANYEDKGAILRQLTSQFGDAEAAVDEKIVVATGPDGALAGELKTIRAAWGGNEALINVQAIALAATDGYAARYAITAGVDDGLNRSASFMIDVPVDPDEPCRIVLKAGQTVILNNADEVLALFDGDVFNAAIIPNLVAEKITSGMLKSPGMETWINLNTGDFSFGNP